MKHTNDIDFLHFGIKTIDMQHQKFFTLLKELELYNSNRDDNLAIATIIDELKAYVQYHFDLEERMMTRSQFPEIEAHLKQHAFFIQKIDEFKFEFEYQSAALSDQMVSFLKKWFLVHIPTWDKDYVDFIKERKTKKLDDADGPKESDT